MKKVLLASLFVALLVAVIVMAFKLRRLSPPEEYEYSFRTDIDADYHDQRALKDYYATGYEVGSFAREMWHTHGINVRYAEADDASARAAVLHYNGLKAYADSLGARLSRSLQLKSKGLSNHEIKLMDDAGLPLDEAQLVAHYGAAQLFKGERNKGVLLMQQQLIGLGYVIPTDGYFFTETEAALRDFQTKHQLSSTGLADKATLKALLQSAPNSH